MVDREATNIQHCQVVKVVNAGSNGWFKKQLNISAWSRSHYWRQTKKINTSLANTSLRANRCRQWPRWLGLRCSAGWKWCQSIEIKIDCSSEWGWPALEVSNWIWCLNHIRSMHDEGYDVSGTTSDPSGLQTSTEQRHSWPATSTDGHRPCQPLEVDGRRSCQASEVAEAFKGYGSACSPEALRLLEWDLWDANPGPCTVGSSDCEHDDIRLDATRVVPFSSIPKQNFQLRPLK